MATSRAKWLGTGRSGSGQGGGPGQGGGLAVSRCGLEADRRSAHDLTEVLLVVVQGDSHQRGHIEDAERRVATLASPAGIVEGIETGDGHAALAPIDVKGPGKRCSLGVVPETGLDPRPIRKLRGLEGRKPRLPDLDLDGDQVQEDLSRRPFGGGWAGAGVRVPSCCVSGTRRHIGEGIAHGLLVGRHDGLTTLHW